LCGRKLYNWLYTSIPKPGQLFQKAQELTPVEGMKAFPATGKKNYVRTAEVMRIENGQFAEHWDVVDETNMLFALGILTNKTQIIKDKLNSHEKSNDRIIIHLPYHN
jgi:hypothetical protein